jgi:hypothetical protein
VEGWIGRGRDWRKLSRLFLKHLFVRAVIETTEGLKLQVDFGYDETALVCERQVIREEV